MSEMDNNIDNSSTGSSPNDFAAAASATPQRPHLPSWRDEPVTSRNSKGPLIFFLFLVLIVLSASLFFLECSKRNKPISKTVQTPTVAIAKDDTKEKKPSTVEEKNNAAEQALADAGTAPLLPKPEDPVDLITAIGNALSQNDLATAERLIGENALNADTRARLRALSADNRLKLRIPNPVREVGELEINRRARYSLELAEREPGRDRIYFDLTKGLKGWEVDKLTLPPAGNEEIPRALIVDSLGISDAFLLAALQQNFTLAKEFVNTETVSDATLAGLCILFEEGNYRLRVEKPLRATLQKEQLATFLANVEAADGSQAAQFGITLRKSEGNPNWVIDELNLDQLLSDYANRFAGGDVYFTPLIKNPAGGDTLVLYFDFAAEELTLRTQRQLAIVAMILKTDNKKKIHLSGHTDAIGSESYNQQLSGKRANSVRDFLVQSGVDPAQIITAAKGLSQPRRPNTKEDGEDDPDGRRANRRTEIYLDF